MTEISTTQDRRRGLEMIRFGEYLRERHLLTDEQLLCALADHWSNGGRIGDAIARLGLMDTATVERYARSYHGLDVVEVGGHNRALA